MHSSRISLLNATVAFFFKLLGTKYPHLCPLAAPEGGCRESTEPDRAGGRGEVAGGGDVSSNVGN